MPPFVSNQRNKKVAEKMDGSRISGPVDSGDLDDDETGEGKRSGEEWRAEGWTEGDGWGRSLCHE